MTTDLNIYSSNRLEILARELAHIVRQPLPSSIAPEIIVVQSRGMQRWISMELARHNGICANCLFLFPNALLQLLFKRLMPDLPDQSLFDPDALTFRIMKILPGCMHRPGFESLQHYLDDDANNLKLFQISEKIADLFDQYLIFRAEMIFDWEKGREGHWQAQLWRLLVNAKEPVHRARLRQALFEKIKNKPSNIENFPPRVSIFGISYLPWFHLEVFVAISRLAQANLFMMNPCKEHWADIVSNTQIKNIHVKYQEANNSDAELHLDKGNTLLASMGSLGRDFFEMISNLDGRIYEQYDDPGGRDVLAGIQSDILYLRDRGIPGHGDILNSSELENSAKASLSRRQLPPDIDSSIQVHSCHSPMREIEVLHDNLLAMFEQDPQLKPRDIIVMTPDIESYGPYIQAVFDAQIDAALRIPFSIADMGVRKASRGIDGFFSILDLANSRFSVPSILALLEVPGIKEKFNLSAADIEIAERWIQATNIRWGIDAQHRSKIGLPPFAENTWRAGIERLLLGYALPGNNQRMFSGILPYDHIEGSEARSIGKFLEFIERLFNVVNALQQKSTLKDWHTMLVDILEQFFAPNEELEREMEVLRRRLDDLSGIQDISGFNTAIEIEVVRSYLDNLLKQEDFGTGFITTGVTFCAMLPMRSIPFKVICLVGMNSDAFPRESKTLGFDLMAQKPKIGDRSRRYDDKYLFLEALISARDKLYLSYVGQSIQDNTPAPPSVLVSELLDYISVGFGFSSEQLITRHRLQAFSPAYFSKESDLFSYSAENFAAVQSRRDLQDSKPLISAALPEPSLEWKNVDIDTLCTFISNPAKFFLQKRLGIYLTETDTVSEEKENFSLSGLDKYILGHDLVNSRVSGTTLEDCLAVQRAGGRLPHGNVGELVYNEMSVDAEIFVRKIKDHTKSEPLKALKVDLEIADFHLAGRISGIHEDALIRVSYTSAKPKYLLNTWIYHLVLCALVEDKYPRSSLLLCKNSVMEFERVSNSTDIIEYLLSLYWQGMSEPLHFFPESSFDYAKRMLIKKQAESVALKAAQQKWLGNDFARGESEDPYYNLCFREIDPLNEAFQNIAVSIAAPLLNHCTEMIV